jgi:hypothetical protein
MGVVDGSPVTQRNMKRTKRDPDQGVPRGTRRERTGQRREAGWACVCVGEDRKEAPARLRSEDFVGGDVTML